MAQYRKKPVIIEATQWFKPGDHPNVRHYANPLNKTIEGVHHAAQRCEHCQKPNGEHGWIGGHIVCPGDFVVTGVNGEHYPVKADIFAQTYEPIEINLSLSPRD